MASSMSSATALCWCLGVLLSGARASEEGLDDGSILVQVAAKAKSPFFQFTDAAPKKTADWSNGGKYQYNFDAAEHTIVGKRFDKEVSEDWITPSYMAKKQVDYLKNRRLMQLWENCGPSIGRTRFYAQSWEDVMLLSHYFCNVKQGHYAEMGALDGKQMSTTKFFEDSMNWGGMLVEGQPDNAAKVAVNRPGAGNKIFPMAACPRGQKTLKFIGAGGHGVGGSVETMSDKHRLEWGLDAKHDKQEYEVPCQPVGDMLAQAKLPYVDFFVLDVEGAEQAVLQTMDWKVDVCVWVVELDGKNPEKDESVRQMLFSRGYKKSTWDFTKMCRSISHHEKDCQMGNEVFEHPKLQTCGSRGRVGSLAAPVVM